MRDLLDRLKAWAARLERQIVVLWLAVRDPAIPLSAKAVALVTVAYALSPIDLVPDFVPVFGLLDDLLIVPLGVTLAVRLIPECELDRLQKRAKATQIPSSSIAGAAIVLAIWLGALYAVADWMNFEPL